MFGWGGPRTRCIALWMLGLWLLGTTATAQVIPAKDGPADPQIHHPGDLVEDGNAFGIQGIYIVEQLSNVKGGVARNGRVLGNLNLLLDLDAEKAFGWKGGSFHTYVLGNHGGSFSQYVGDFQVVSHIEAPATLTLFEAAAQQKLLNDRLSLLVGLYAVDSEFDTRDCSALFVHSSPGTGGELGQIGINGPGIFPVGSLGVRVRYADAGWYGQVAVLEGIPGDPSHRYGTHLSLQPAEGILAIGEAGHVWSDDQGPLGKVALGAWGFSRPYQTFMDPNAQATNRGGYLSLEKTFSRESGDATQGLAGYLRVGLADGRINPIENFVGAALVYTGPFHGRDKDQLGLAVNSGFTGQDYRLSGDFEGHETAIELTYSIFVNEHLSVQPDIQYILNPGFDPALKNALVLGLRAVFSVRD